MGGGACCIIHLFSAGGIQFLDIRRENMLIGRTPEWLSNNYGDRVAMEIGLLRSSLNPLIKFIWDVVMNGIVHMISMI